MEKLMDYGIERLRDGAASVAKDPVQKGDRFEWNSQGYLIRIFRDEKPLYWLGQVIGWTAGAEGSCLRHSAGEAGCLPAAGYEIVVLHLTVEHEPGYISKEELEREGFESKEAFTQAFGERYGRERLWKPAWRIRCGVVPSQLDLTPAGWTEVVV